LSAESVTLLAVGYIYGGIWAPPPTGLSPVRTKASFAAPPQTGITEVVTAPRSPWQNPYVERVIGSIRRECLDHLIIFNEHHLRRVLCSYVDYYHHSRTHLSLDKDCPHSRLVQPPQGGRVIALPQVGGLHHRYERLAA
ncbi:MAG: integrase core domain-containing protein, partial [Candidatus Binataceae bacterium]